MKLTGPLALAAGVNSSVPSAFSVTEPAATATEPPGRIACPSMAVMVSGSPSTSLSLASTGSRTAASSAVTKPSASATGASLTAPTLTA